MTSGLLSTSTINITDPKSTVVPNRNMIFVSILAGIAQSSGYDEILLANNKTDMEHYPDCRLNYLTSMQKAVEISTEGKVSIVYPFTHLYKMDIVKLGYDYEIPFDLTRTCYEDQEDACGVCPSCCERIKAFQATATMNLFQYDV